MLSSEAIICASLQEEARKYQVESVREFLERLGLHR